MEKPKPVSICECLSSRAILYLIPKESFPGRKAFSKSCRNFRSAKGAPARAQQLPHVIPSIYLANYLNDFEPLFPRYGVTLRKFSKGDILTQQGVIHNTAYFIKSGILQLSLGHDQGEKALNLFGPGKEEVLATSRKQLTILDDKKLLAHCTPGLRENL